MDTYVLPVAKGLTYFYVYFFQLENKTKCVILFFWWSDVYDFNFFERDQCTMHKYLLPLFSPKIGCWSSSSCRLLQPNSFLSILIRNAIPMSLYNIIPKISMMKPSTCHPVNGCQSRNTGRVMTQIISVRTLSNTIRVVALISLVTLMPAKLKKAILKILPKNITRESRDNYYQYYQKENQLCSLKKNF